MKRFFLALLPLFLYYLISIPVWFLLTELLGDGTENGKYAMMQGIASLCTLPVLYILYRKDKATVQDSRKHLLFAAYDKSIGVSFLLGGAAVALLATALNNLLGLLSVTEMSAGWNTARENFYNGTFASELIFLGIVVPFVEEFLYRGVMYGRMRKIFSGKLTILFTTLIFAILHFNLAQILYAFLIGLLLGLLRERYGTFLPAAIGHMFANLVAIFRQEGILNLPSAGTPAIILTVVFVAAGAGLLFLLIKQPRVRR